MTCFHPNILLVKNNSPDGKKKLIKYINSKGPDFKGYDYYKNKNLDLSKDDLQYVEVPCNQCIGCVENYSRQWSIRCMLESRLYKSNYFITFTYDDEHLPTCEGISCLNKDDIIKFIKDLRSFMDYHFNTKVRFFGCGEYGPKTQRPHYHYIFFNLEISPEWLQIYNIDRDGQITYLCPQIERIWGKGRLVFGSVTEKSCAYVARYCTKKLMKKHDRLDSLRPIEFIHMSRKPGIGADLYNRDIYKNDEIILDNGSVQLPPKFFDKKLRDEDELLYDYVKDMRSFSAENAQLLESLQSSFTREQLLAIKERTKFEKFKTLKRDKN